MLGLLGGGQLGRMFIMAAQSMGYRVTVLDPANNGPASSMAERHLRADYLDPDALRELGSSCAAVTTEFENVPAESLKILARALCGEPRRQQRRDCAESYSGKKFSGDEWLRGRAVCGHRGFEGFGGSPVSPGCLVIATSRSRTFRGLVSRAFSKVSRMGYDGKGQIRVNNATELDAAFVSLNREPCVLERLLPLECEVSVIVARGFDSIAVTFPVSENRHRNGILDVSIVPARDCRSHSFGRRATRQSALPGSSIIMAYCASSFLCSRTISLW